MSGALTDRLFDGLRKELRERLLDGARNKTVLLPEGHDPRVVEAGRLLKEVCGVRAIILGDPGQSLLAPDDVVNVLRETAQRRGKVPPVPEVLAELATEPLFVAGAALETGLCDAVVAGSVAETARVIKAALMTVGLASGVATLTSAFAMNLAHPTAGEQNPLVFADAGVVPEPTSLQLADIAVLAARAYERWFAAEAHVALLSYSTMGSAVGPPVTKVTEAANLLARHHPELAVLGEVQLDAAVDPDVAARKIPAGRRGRVPPGGCNVLVFPNLDAGNICYKAVERLGGARAWGPVLLGAGKAYADLSRGCKPMDIVHVACLALALG